MNQPSPSPRGGPLARRVLHVVRRVAAPAALEMQAELPALRARLAELEAETATLRERVAAGERRADHAETRVGELAGETAVLRDGLHEARRLNLRIAELTDVVTELVLPLHDREIDPAVLATLRGDVS